MYLLLLRFTPFCDIAARICFAEFRDCVCCRLVQDTSNGEAGRVAYVKLRNEAAAEKAVMNLHRTKAAGRRYPDELCRITLGA